MKNQLRNATITKDDTSIEAIVFDSGEIYALVNDTDADFLPYNAQTIDDCLICGFIVMER